jgi:hypothetical protein
MLGGNVTDDLATLPEAARAAIESALACADPSSTEAVEHTRRAFAAVDFPVLDPQRPVYPLPASLTAPQRTLVALAAAHDLRTAGYAFPGHAAAQRRWLGLEPGGALETVTVDVENVGPQPLWRALQLAPDIQPFLAILDGLPVEVALRALGELLTGRCTPRGAILPCYAVSNMIGNVYLRGRFLSALRLVKDLRGEARDWAIAKAELCAGDLGPLPGWASRCRPSSTEPRLHAYIYLALMRAGVPIKREWEPLFPSVTEVSEELLMDCIQALPPERRGPFLRPIAQYMPGVRWLRVIEAFPSEDLARGMLEWRPPNSQGWQWTIDSLRTLGKTHPILLETAEAVVAETPEPIDLFVTRIAKPATVDELSDLQKEQLRIAGKGYDEQDLPASARLAADDSEASFLGYLEFREIVDATGKPLFDALLLNVDAGVVFEAGTTKERGSVVQGGVVLQPPDPAMKEAVQIAVGPKPKRKAAKKVAKKAPRRKG